MTEGCFEFPPFALIVVGFKGIRTEVSEITDKVVWLHLIQVSDIRRYKTPQTTADVVNNKAPCTETQ